MSGSVRDPLFFRHGCVVPIVTALLGETVTIGEAWVRSVSPGAPMGQVHRDGGRGDIDRSAGLGVDLLLTDFHTSNGATEIWPRSHRIRDRDLNDVRETRYRALLHASTQVSGPAGSFVLRYGRLWHRAGANRSSERRTMLSIGYRPGVAPRRLQAALQAVVQKPG